jgi:hypothetical protein
MLKNASYVDNILGDTPSASEHTDRVAKEQYQEVNQQKLAQGKQDTDLPYQPEPSGDEYAASHFDGTPNQRDGIITHDNTFTTRRVPYDHYHDHVMSGGRIDDPPTNSTVKQDLKENSYELSGVAHDQDNLPAVHGKENRFQSITDDQFHDDAAATTMQVLPEKTCALVGGCSGHPASQIDETREHIEKQPSVKDHDNASPTMLASLRYQAYAPIEGPMEVLRKDFNADSHELAYAVSEAQGAIQTDYTSASNAEVARDIGWHKANIEIPDPLIGGYTNGELFAVIRRFNKVGLKLSRRNFSWANLRLIRMSLMSKRCLSELQVALTSMMHGLKITLGTKWPCTYNEFICP